jgi:diadenosine tetraphosphate (Ap4A) HIT family hydrolase
MFYKRDVVKNFDKQDLDIAKRMVGESELAFAFLNKMPIVPGHTLICPKRTVADSSGLSTEEWFQILQLKEVVCQGLRHLLGAEGFNFAWNEGGEVAGQTVPHFHLHIVPRQKGDTSITQYEPRVFLYRPGTRSTSPEEELISLAQLLRLRIGSK